MNEKSGIRIGIATAVIAIAMLAMVPGAAGLACNCGDICVNMTGWWHDDGAFNASGTPIQAAVNDATPEETICVKDGTYTENVGVGKRLTIKSENGYASTTVNAASSSLDVFKVTASQVNITGFTVTGATTRSGIKLYYVNGCNISYNNASYNKWGIYLDHTSYDNIIEGNIVKGNTMTGINLKSSNENVVSGNTVTDNKYGIYLYLSTSNVITNKSAGNTVMNNSQRGFYLYDADNNEITCNLVVYNGEEGFRLYGGSTGNNISLNNIIENGNYNATSGGWEWNFHNYQTPDVVAEDNYWGTTVSSKIAASIKENTGDVDYEPFLSNPSPCAPTPPVAEKVIPADVTIEPETLNVKSNGEWITAYIELPECYNVADINCSTIRLEDEIAADSCDRPLESVIGDHDENGIPDLMVKFDRAEVIEYLEPGESVELCVTGEVAGKQFKGCDTIRVIE